MPSLKDLKNRITSVKSTRKITKAMQMVAAAKLKRAQDAATASRPYASRMASVLANLSASAGAGGPKLLAGTGEDKTHLIVVMTAERGLAGGFGDARRTHAFVTPIRHSLWSPPPDFPMLGCKAAEGHCHGFG